MIAQHPGVAVREHERKHIEIGLILTLSMAIISFYSIPNLDRNVPVEKHFEPPPVELVSIPATFQPPDVAEPMRPTLPMESADLDFADDVEAIIIGDEVPWELLEKPPEPEIPTVPFWAVEVKPMPIGGWDTFNKKVIYPPIAIEARQEGKVTIEVVIGKDGMIKDAFITQGLPGTGLDEAAMTAVLNTKFSPAYQRDKPVQVSMFIPVDFRLR